MAEKVKLIPLSRIRPKDPDSELDSVVREKKRGSRRTFDILMQAQQYWNNMDQFRRDRERCKKYTYGDQWSDKIDVDGKLITEEEYIRREGNTPLKNNVIRHTVRSILGVYRGQCKEPICTARDREEQSLSETMTTLLQCNMQINRLSEIYARSLEEFLISGMVVHRKYYGWENGTLDCWTDVVDPETFFIDNNMRDFRGWDVSMLGEVHDVSFQKLCRRFAKSPEDTKRLREIYTDAAESSHIVYCAEKFGYSSLKNLDFLFTNQPGRCRVIEVWRLESKPRYQCHDYCTAKFFKCELDEYQELVVAENEDRIRRGTALGMSIEDIPLIKSEYFLDEYWYYYYLTPFGDVLEEGETPYAHQSHPYVFKLYPFINGEIHSYVADIIDQQRYINRLITMYDWVMRASAKGVLLFPEECLPDGMSMEEIADEWSRFNSMILFKAKAGSVIPQQISNNATNVGISELLNVQLKLVEEISGVNGALQGKTGYAGTSAALYNQQTQNAATALLDVMESYGTFVIETASKNLKLIQQYYDDKRIKNIAGKNASVAIDPSEIRNLEFDVSISESTSTPAYRQMATQMLMELWKAQAISTEMLLEHADIPYADELLQAIKSQKAQLEQGQTPDAISPELQQRVAQSANQTSVNRLYNGITAPQANEGGIRQ
jgi:hypothetical protein